MEEDIKFNEFVENKDVYGVLFNSIPINDEDHLEVILNTMDKDTSIYMLHQAINHAFKMGCFTIGECEILSKAMRISSKKE
jgi:hypothetical protein